MVSQQAGCFCCCCYTYLRLNSDLIMSQCVWEGLQFEISPSSDFLFYVIRLSQNLITATAKSEGEGQRETRGCALSLQKCSGSAARHIQLIIVELFNLQTELFHICYNLALRFIILAFTAISYCPILLQIHTDSVTLPGKAFRLKGREQHWRSHVSYKCCLT